MLILSCFNHKGGSAKTTMNFQLASKLSKMRNFKDSSRFNKVLLIDLDEQINLTTIILKDEIENCSIDELIMNDMFVEEGIITPLTEYPNLDFIPGSRNLKSFDLYLNTKKVAQENVVKKYFKKNNDILNEYDYIFIDLGPSTNLVNLNAFIILDKIIVPLYHQMLDSVKGATAFIKSYKQDMDELELENKAQIVTFVNGFHNKETKISKAFSNELIKHDELNKILLKSKINESDVIKNAMIESLSLEDYICKNKINSKVVAVQMNELIKELEEREVL